MKALIQQLLAVIERLCDLSNKNPNKIDAYVKAKEVVK